jgi:hypothetical protein
MTLVEKTASDAEIVDSIQGRVMQKDNCIDICSLYAKSAELRERANQDRPDIVLFLLFSDITDIDSKVFEEKKT